MADESAKEFLLAEYENLRELRTSQIAQGENRLNYFLLVVFGVAVALETIYSIDVITDQTKQVLGGIILVGTLLMGLTTLGRTLERNIFLMQASRGMSRIRNYFVTSNPSISKHLILSIHDDARYYLPYSSGGFFRTGGIALMIAITNAILVAVIVILGLSVVPSPPFWLLLSASLGGAASSFIFQIALYDQKLNDAEKRQGYSFPSLEKPTTTSG